jgi:hypothetical protein
VTACRDGEWRGCVSAPACREAGCGCGCAPACRRVGCGRVWTDLGGGSATRYPQPLTDGQGFAGQSVQLSDLLDYLAGIRIGIGVLGH